MLSKQHRENEIPTNVSCEQNIEGRVDKTYTRRISSNEDFPPLPKKNKKLHHST